MKKAFEGTTDEIVRKIYSWLEENEEEDEFEENNKEEYQVVVEKL